LLIAPLLNRVVGVDAAWAVHAGGVAVEPVRRVVSYGLARMLLAGYLVGVGSKVGVLLGVLLGVLPMRKDPEFAWYLSPPRHPSSDADAPLATFSAAPLDSPDDRWQQQRRS
jgi:hypothetical protein